jgi:hypothetical protein
VIWHRIHIMPECRTISRPLQLPDDSTRGLGRARRRGGPAARMPPLAAPWHVSRANISVSWRNVDGSAGRQRHTVTISPACQPVLNSQATPLAIVGLSRHRVVSHRLTSLMLPHLGQFEMRGISYGIADLRNRVGGCGLLSFQATKHHRSYMLQRGQTPVVSRLGPGRNRPPGSISRI